MRACRNQVRLHRIVTTNANIKEPCGTGPLARRQTRSTVLSKDDRLLIELKEEKMATIEKNLNIFRDNRRALFRCGIVHALNADIMPDQRAFTI